MTNEIAELDKTIDFMKRHIYDMEAHVAECERNVARLQAKRWELMRQKYTTEDCIVKADPTFAMTWPVNRGD